MDAPHFCAHCSLYLIQNNITWNSCILDELTKTTCQPSYFITLPTSHWQPPCAHRALPTQASTAHCELPLCSPPHKSTAARITARSTSTAAWGKRKKVQNKTQDHFTHRSHVQTLLFWDAIHLCNRAGISQTLLRPEICCQSHMQRLLPSALQSCGWPGFEDQNLNSQQGKRGMEGRRGNLWAHKGTDAKQQPSPPQLSLILNAFLCISVVFWNGHSVQNSAEELLQVTFNEQAGLRMSVCRVLFSFLAFRNRWYPLSPSTQSLIDLNNKHNHPKANKAAQTTTKKNAENSLIDYHELNFYWLREAKLLSKQTQLSPAYFAEFNPVIQSQMHYVKSYFSKL